MAAIQWEKGGEARIVRADSDFVLLYSSIAGAPGSRLQGTLSTGTGIRVRVSKCRRLQDNPVFRIEGRLLDATRATMNEVARLAEPETTVEPLSART